MNNLTDLDSNPHAASKMIHLSRRQETFSDLQTDSTCVLRLVIWVLPGPYEKSCETNSNERLAPNHTSPLFTFEHNYCTPPPCRCCAYPQYTCEDYLFMQFIKM